MAFDTLRQDLAAAARGLRKTPGFTTAAVLTLALGIGATSTIFTIVNAVLLAPLPYAQPERRVMLWNRWTGFDKTWLSELETIDYRRLCRTVAAVAAWSSGQANLTGGEAREPLRVGYAEVTPNTFEVLGARPLSGRTFAASEDRQGVDRVTVISHRLWQSYFGGDPGVIGQTLHLDGVTRTIVGIMPAGFQLPTDFGEDSAEPSLLWVPLFLDPASTDRGNHGYYGAAVLASGATADQASAELRTIAAAWTREGLYPPEDDFHTFAVPLEQEVRGAIRPVLLLLAGAVAFVLLIACANVANLLLARAEGRQREVAVRVALGASPWRIARQLFTEGLVLALLGTAAGIGIAMLATRLVQIVNPSSLPKIGEVQLDARVLAFTTLVGCATTIIFGLVPVLRAGRVHLTEALRDGSTTATTGGARVRLRALLVIAETAMAVVLATGAGLMIRSVDTLQRVELGFDPSSLLTMRIALPAASYATPAQVVATYERLLERVRSLPGVTHAGLMRSLPLATTIGDSGFTVEGWVPPYAGASPKGDWQVVSPGALEALGERVVRGRAIHASDTATSPPVALVNETMARMYWPGQDPIGRRIRQGGPNRPWITIVGVVADVRHNGLEAEIKGKYYRAHTQFAVTSTFVVRNMHLLVKTSADPMTLAAPIRAEMRAIDPSVPLANIRPMEEVVATAMAQPRLAQWVLVLFGVAALLLAAVGLYGVLSYVVSERHHEIGIRMAVGADPARVRSMVLRQGLALGCAGAVAGSVLAFVLARFASGMLHGVAPHDPVTFALVPLVLVVVAAAASWIPAWRATRVSPLRALKSE